MNTIGISIIINKIVVIIFVVVENEWGDVGGGAGRGALVLSASVRLHEGGVTMGASEGWMDE